MKNDQRIQLLLLEGGIPIKMLLERTLPTEEPLVVTAGAGETFLEQIANQHRDGTQLDFALPGVGRIETHRLGGEDGAADLVVVRGEPIGGGDSQLDEESGEYYSYLTKPVSAAELVAIAREAANATKASEADPAEPPHKPLRTISGRIFGASEAMHKLIRLVHRVAAGNASILIHGETGTGKSLLARELHAASPRCDQRFVAINCSAFQDQLLESELFGYEKGAFTGAVAAKPGLFEIAHRGTLFLDEIADMSSAMQAKLLQVLDDGELRRVGGTESRKVDVRIVAASNKKLTDEVEAERFREDLLFRLNVIHLEVPPLRQRSADISDLVERFLERFQLPDQPSKRIMPAVMQLLKRYNWPGNVRELANMIEGLVLLAPGDVIGSEDLPPKLRPSRPLETDDEEAPLPLSEIERLHVIRALTYTKGKKAPAARLLGIDVKTLGNKIRSYKIKL